MKRHRTRLVAAALMGALIASAIARPGAALTEPATMGVDELAAGQRGWGLSVFRGSEPERFEVEILGVLRELQPGISFVMARLTGAGLEQTGVIAGMSGSPVYVDDRLVGAVAFAWPFSHEAIAGITPIAAMRGIESAAPWPGGAASPRPRSLAEIVARELPAESLGEAVSRLAGPQAAGARAALLWGAAGFADRTVAELAQWLPGLAAGGSLPLAGRSAGAGGGGDATAALGPGGSVAQVWIDGDLRLAATGTVTERAGDRILAFGHPVTALGDARMPMASAEVVTVLSRSLASFKLANLGPVVGAFERDHAAGVLGRLGASAPTVPLAIAVGGPSPRRFELRLAAVPALLPVLAAIGTLGSLDVAAPIGGLESVDLRFLADLGGAGRLELRQSFDGPNAGIQTVLYLLAVVDFLERNDFGAVDLQGLEVEVIPFAAPRATELVGLHAERTRVEPGELVRLVLDLRPYRGDVVRRRLEVQLPEDLPAGRYTLLVGDGVSADAARLALEPEQPVTLTQALDLLRSLGSARELAVIGVLAGRGLSTQGALLPRLPGSIRAIWSASGDRSARPLRLAIAQSARSAEPVPLAGLLRVDLDVRRPEPIQRGGASPEGAGTRPPDGASGRPAAGPAGAGRSKEGT